MSRLKAQAAVARERTLAAFPVRVWRHFLRQNGFLLSAGMSYQGLFALFGLLYMAFAGVGIWLGGSDRAVQALIDGANAYIPGLISKNGVASPAEVESIAESTSGVLSVTGAIAAGVVIWSATTAVTFTRRAIRDIFGLPFDARNFLLLKFWDLIAATAFGLSLLIGSALSLLGVWTVARVVESFGGDPTRPLYEIGLRAFSVLVAMFLDAAVLALLVRYLTGTELPWHRIIPGSLVGGGAIVVLQLGAGLLLSHTPTNPLLATFAVVVSMLIWCRAVSIVVLIAASWISVGAGDHDQPLQAKAESITHEAEVQALVIAARVRVRHAQEALDESPWWLTPITARRLRRARRDWRKAVSDAKSEGLPVVEAPSEEVSRDG
ncbi:YihY/virulence factor BrkB family protein [Microbacterium sp.]|uniref:YihY/virulence factor BrkB family protein n=1 Tax=Microbacterium sp. TaxID=51671 RepID=UPI00281194F0|nr:YihY/virulence factor BrkB family protein [Microbacterium sp.]